MKFRGKIEDISLVHSINRLVNIFSKQHSEIVLRMNETHMIFISREIKEGVQIYAKLPARFIFIEYCCEGVCPEANEIYISLDSEKLLRTLKLASKQSKSVIFKLTQKNHNSFIEIVIEQKPNLCSENIRVNHDIPIQVLSRKDWGFYDEIVIENTEDTFYLPPTKHIKNVVDKQKNFDRYLTLTLHNNTLTLKVCNILCEISTLYESIQYKNPIEDREVMKTIDVDSARFSAFLNSLNLGVTVKVEVNLLEQQLINFKFTFDHINVSFTIPHMLNL